MSLHVAVAESRTVLLPLWQESTDWETVTERKGQQWPPSRGVFASQAKLRTGPVKAAPAGAEALGITVREKEARKFQRDRGVGSAVGKQNLSGVSNQEIKGRKTWQNPARWVV